MRLIWLFLLIFQSLYAISCQGSRDSKKGDVSEKYKVLKMEVIIRKESVQDYAIVEKTVKSAFEKAEHTDGKEHILVKNLRNSKAFIPELSLVAEEAGKVVGHILFTKILIEGANSNKEGLALAPIAIRPSHQGQGIGGKLIEKGHMIAKELGFQLIVLLGHPSYYPRFGYKPASTFNIKAPFDVPNDAFMAIVFDEKDKAKYSGTVKYPKEFGI